MVQSIEPAADPLVAAAGPIARIVIYVRNIDTGQFNLAAGIC
jgi:hypothetical protein